jgi:alanine-glyoxylate transaminase / serine-glyoxylate transaminase / serine-pyruvate transaminase
MSDISYLHIKPPERILMGPGPSNVDPRVYSAMQAQIVGHLDPYFITVMEDTMNLLRLVFRTRNKLTFPISGTGSAGMEACFDNFLEPGDAVIIGVNGLFGERMADNAARCGATVIPVKADWGLIIEPESLETAFQAQKKVKMLTLVHAETSTGVLQPLEQASRLAKQYGALFMVDTVTSLGGHEVSVDDWGIDICYSGTQKCLSCPPGLAPFTANEKALAVLQGRTRKVPSWYLDLSMLYNYWGSNRFYHHTAPINMVYALHEALAVIVDEGLDVRLKRHLKNGAALHAGLQAMGLELHAQEGHRLSSLTTVRVPDGIDELRMRQSLLSRYGIEIGAGLGPLKSRVWRVGLMGHTSTARNLIFFLSSLERLMAEQGHPVQPAAGVAAALDILGKT